MEKDIADILYELQNVRGFLFIGLGFFVLMSLSVAFASFVAIQLLKELLSTARANNSIFRDDAEDLLSRGNSDDALELILERLKTHPNDIEATVFKGRAYYIAGKYHEAQRAFDDAFSLNPTSDVTVDLWQQRIKKKLNESSPKIVD
jgi:tetratricopeptide (TPR) repeat protein